MSFERVCAMEFLRGLVDFSRKRTGMDAVLFYVFYVGCFAILTAVMQNGL